MERSLPFDELPMHTPAHHVSNPCSVCGRRTTIVSTSEGRSLCDECLRHTTEKTREFGALDRDADGVATALVEPLSEIGPGDLLAGRFEVLRRLGRGGMGEVFEAADQVLEDRVALKVVHGSRTASAASLKRLRREVQLARRVTHNNVCRIFDLFQHHDDTRDVVLDLVSMELLDGETLRQRMKRQGQMTVENALPIVRQVARGLVAAHRLGIVHRDLKPSNVMLIEEDFGLRAAITDFGLAHSVDPQGRRKGRLTRDGDLIGSPAFMAPEQASGDPTSPATDIYSLGVMLYEMLAAELPFSGKSAWLMMVDRLTGKPTPLQNHRPDLDPFILSLVDRCLERNPVDRFPSVKHLLTHLDLGDRSWDFYGGKAHDSGSVAVEKGPVSTISQSPPEATESADGPAAPQDPSNPPPPRSQVAVAAAVRPQPRRNLWILVAVLLGGLVYFLLV